MGGADVDMSNTSQNTSPGRVLGPLINEHSCPSRTQIPIGLKMFAFELEKPHLQDPHVACLSLQAGNIPLKMVLHLGLSLLKLELDRFQCCKHLPGSQTHMSGQRT